MFCINCKKEYDESHKFKECLKANANPPGQYKQCPKCKFWVERKNGANKLYCRCGKYFCFLCGKEGCSCNFNSVGSKDFGQLGGNEMEKMRKEYQ